MLVLRGTGALSNWTFVGLLLVVLVVAPGLAGAVLARRERPEIVDAPLERAGVDVPFTEAQLDEIRAHTPVGSGTPA
jgi:hypothetical protein